MPKRSSTPRRKGSSDPILTAARIFQEVTGESVGIPAKVKPPAREKNPAAVALGKLGGPKGGKARAASLSAKRRAQIARKAARARWGAKDGNP
jgi:hypothetical protein